MHFQTYKAELGSLLFLVVSLKIRNCRRESNKAWPINKGTNGGETTGFCPQLFKNTFHLIYWARSPSKAAAGLPAVKRQTSLKSSIRFSLPTHKNTH